MEAKSAENLYARFFAESDTAMAIIDQEGFLLTYNRQMEYLISSVVRHDDLPGRAEAPQNKLAVRSIRDILGARHTVLFWTTLSRVLNDECHEIVYEVSLHPRNEKEGVMHWYNIHAWLLRKKPNALPRDEGPFIGLIMEDKTLAMREEKRLLEDKQIAEKAMEAKSQFLANMSHEIRTPIQTIIGVTELLEDTALDHEQADYSRQVKFSAEVLLSLINDILDYSKIEAGKMMLEYIDFDLAQTVDQSVEMIVLEAHKKSLYIAVDISPAAAITIKGDPNKFRQIIINLVKNAVKFTEEGGITVTVRLTELEKKQAVKVSVADTGVGVSPEARGRLFTTFMQGDVSDSRRFGGTGLGLAISRNLVELMQGRIEMLPNPGGGSVFSFTVPITRSGKGSPRVPAAPEEIKTSPILVADNIKISRDILCSYLADLGCGRVDSVPSGEEALDAMRKAAEAGKPYRICFISMLMPVMDGWRLGSEINDNPKLKGSSLVLMVPHGRMGKDTKMKFLKWFSAYIYRPIKRGELAEALFSVLRNENEDAEITELESVENWAFAAEETEETEEARRERRVTPKEREKSPLVLVAEDHPINQKLLSMMIEKSSFRCICADNGREAVEKAMANSVELVFMDIQMPEMNGYEATAELRKLGFNKPVIAVTASAFSNERELCMKSGANDFLIKPVKRADIDKMLSKWFKSEERGRNSGPAKKNTPAKSGEFAIPVVEASTARSFVTRENLFFPDEKGPVEKDAAKAAPRTPEKKPGKQIFAAGAESKKAAGADDPGIFSPDDLLDTFMDNDEMALAMLHRFIERSAAQIQNIPALMDAAAWEDAMREAHTIKGAAYTMGSKDLGAAAGRLEKDFRNMESADMEDALSSLRKAFERFRKAAEDFLSSKNFRIE